MKFVVGGGLNDIVAGNVSIIDDKFIHYDIERFSHQIVVPLSFIDPIQTGIHKNRCLGDDLGYGVEMNTPIYHDDHWSVVSITVAQDGRVALVLDGPMVNHSEIKHIVILRNVDKDGVKTYQGRIINDVKDVKIEYRLLETIDLEHPNTLTYKQISHLMDDIIEIHKRFLIWKIRGQL
ncbi:hypothetical protein phiOC_p025 [Ochrobactrum phage vB_OspM_OC]|nr:hypothetical protein phiOC_p025 [Ochrobactrum phage vB_OspM_OC]